MILFPAIDLRSGRAVRLRQGRADAETVWADDPAEVARRWEREGAPWLHVVDLDRALGVDGARNDEALRSIFSAVRIPVQLGGGLRDLASVEGGLARGARRIVLGTLAVERPDVLAEIVKRMGAERVAVAADVRGGRIATRGWQEQTDITLVEFGRWMRGLGIERAVVTDIARDGMLSGVDAAAYAQAAQDTGLSIVASGGVASLGDLERLAAVESSGVEGAIIGQALYAGAFTLAEALDAVRGSAAGEIVPSTSSRPKRPGRSGKGAGE